jgi:phage terminase large subunit-like protein
MLDTHLDKVMRANNSIARINKLNYNVIVNNEISFIEDLKHELLSFPNGIHDDIVDCIVYAIKIALAKEPSVFDSMV